MSRQAFRYRNHIGSAMITPMAARPRERTAIPPYDTEDRGPTSAMAISSQLREEILRKYDDGQLVGSEEDLIARFAVSRPTMRQAVRVLQAEGLLTVKRGLHGGFFAKVPSTEVVSRSLSMLLRHRGATFGQLVDALMPLSDAMVRAAASADPDRRAAAAVSILDYEPPEGMDERTRIIHAATHFGSEIDVLVDNPVITLLCEVLTDLATNGVRDRPSGAGRYDGARAWHCAIAEAIRDGDQEAVTRLNEAMREQLATWVA
jgi:GntR family transcriptional regulator, transcriptional repressor for pyruvate dehydrogenase complex